MKKKIIIESEDNAEVKKVERNHYKENYHKLINNPIIEWLIYMIGYAIVLITVSTIFTSFYINNEHYGLYALLAAIIIYILNQTIKPALNYLTLPLTIISWCLLYPLSNVLILYITSFILGKENFYLSGFITPFLVAIFISLLNILMEGLILKPLTKGKRR